MFEVGALGGLAGLMNPIAKLVWRLCRISGAPSRYRSEPQRQHLVSVA